MALARLRDVLAALHLRLREEKTSVHHVDEPFTFLGYRLAGGAAAPPSATLRAVQGGLRATGAVATHRARHTVARARRGIDQARATAQGSLAPLARVRKRARRRMGAGGQPGDPQLRTRCPEHPDGRDSSDGSR